MLMDFFYHRRAFDTQISLNQLEHDDHTFLDNVRVGKDVLDSLHINKSDRFALSICLKTRPSSGPFKHLESLICWAIPDDDASTGLSVPSSSWTRPLGLLRSAQPTPKISCSVSPLHLVQLTQIFLVALSTESYELAQSESSILETWFCSESPILRQNTTYSFLHDTGKHKFRLIMVEPVLQGYASAGNTKFFLSLYEEQDGRLVESQESDSSFNSEVGLDSDKEGIEIDESFLAGSVLRSMSDRSPAVSPREKLKDEPLSPQSGLPESSLTSSSELIFLCKSWRDGTPSQTDDFTVYVRTVDLGRVGLLNGDWAVISAPNSQKHRLVCVVAADNIVDDLGTLFASPTLLFNIYGGVVPPESSVTLRASPFGSRRPTIPTAHSVTIARVASPLSTDRGYQSLFLHALKRHFDGSGGPSRLVKQGDIISTNIDTDSLKKSTSLSTGEENPPEAEPIDQSLPVSTSSPSEAVFFLVTNVEHDVVSGDDDGNLPDTYVGSTVGELGCWVDPHITRMIQTGLEQSRVPDVSSHSRTDARSSRALLSSFTRQPSSRLLSAGSPYGKMYKLASAALMKNAAEYRLHLSILLKGARGIGKCSTATWVSQSLGMHLLDIDCFDLIGENDVQTEGTLRARFEKASSCSPCIFLLRHIDAFMQTTQTLEPGKEPYIVNALRECLDELSQPWKLTGYPIIVAGTTSDPGKCSPGLLACFKHEISFESPDETERLEMLTALCEGSILGPDVELSHLATNTAALVAVDLVDLISRAKSASIERTLRSSISSDLVPFDLISAGISLTDADFTLALDNARTSYSESIGAPKIPNVTWDDVGGLASVKADILDTIQLPLEHPELFADGLKKRSGILLYGPPGTGKTLLAKAVATSCSLNFFSVKGPEILNMYIGESEANVRRVFQRARDAKPCVIFFDELDSVAPKRGNQGDSGGVMDRIVSQLLAELDGMTSGNGSSDVFVIGATNRPDLLDPALLRPGRFDRMLYLGVSDTHRAQLNIVEALTRKFRLHPDLNLSGLIEQCPFHYTGADFYALCSDAMLKAMSRKAEEIEAKLVVLNKAPTGKHPYPITPQYYLAEMASPADTEVLVSQVDFELALRELKPSVSETEMEHYRQVQRQFSEKAPTET